MYQKIILVGHLGKDTEMRYTEKAQAVTSFSMATKRSWKSSDERKSETTWWKISVWGAMAEACNQYLHKGSLVQVTGRMVCDDHGGPRIWKTREGEAAASFEVVAEEVTFLDSKKESAASDDF